jgi:methylsterol monooxygenase
MCHTIWYQNSWTESDMKQAWYLWMQNDTLATGILSFTMHEIVYFGRSLPWIIIDAIPFFNKYKIQNVRT